MNDHLGQIVSFLSSFAFNPQRFDEESGEIFNRIERLL